MGGGWFCRLEQRTRCFLSPVVHPSDPSAFTLLTTAHTPPFPALPAYLVLLPHLFTPSLLGAFHITITMPGGRPGMGDYFRTLPLPLRWRLTAFPAFSSSTHARARATTCLWALHTTTPHCTVPDYGMDRQPPGGRDDDGPRGRTQLRQ